MQFETTIKLTDIINSHNLAERLTDQELTDLGVMVFKDFETDLLSRSTWDKRNEEAMKLALQIKEEKSFPWQGASNVKFPLITIAALQYHARSYPVLLGSDTPVKCKVIGEDKDGSKTDRALRVENHMSFQVMEEDVDWESEMDKVLITQPILGCAFKKTYFDPIRGHNISENILAKDFVVNYWSKSIEKAPRATHVLYMSKNDVYEREALGLWLPMEDIQPGEKLSSSLQAAQDQAQGTTPPQSLDSSNPYEILEQHRYLDLDDDGYEEPYIVYIRRDTKQVLRIVARFFTEGVKYGKKNKVLSIQAEQYFTKFPFIPSPDGGFYDLGFGVLLGPLNESINTLINQLIDAGTMATTAGGFLSRGVKIRGGNYSFAPLEWKHVESTGDDLRKGIMPLPVREPSQVLFTLLDLLINYGERIGGSVDVLSGVSPGQNTPAETSRNSVEQGMKIFSGIFKRTYRSLRDEFRKQFRLNQLYITETKYYSDARDNSGTILKDDYNGDASSIRPSADPHVISDSQRLQVATAIKQSAMVTSGYDKYQVELMYLKAMKVPNIDQIFPDPKGPNAQKPLPNPKIQVEEMKMQGKDKELKSKLQLAIIELQSSAELQKAQIVELEAQAVLIYAQAEGIAKGHEIAIIEAKISALKAGQEGALKYMDLMQQAEQAAKEPQEGAAPAPK
jgi:chaperonin GroES